MAANLKIVVKTLRETGFGFSSENADVSEYFAIMFSVRTIS